MDRELELVRAGREGFAVDLCAKVGSNHYRKILTSKVMMSSLAGISACVCVKIDREDGPTEQRSRNEDIPISLPMRILITPYAEMSKLNTSVSASCRGGHDKIPRQ